MMHDDSIVKYIVEYGEFRGFYFAFKKCQIVLLVIISYCPFDFLMAKVLIAYFIISTKMK